MCNHYSILERTMYILCNGTKIFVEVLVLRVQIGFNSWVVKTKNCAHCVFPNVDFPKGLEKLWNSMEFQSFPYQISRSFWNLLEFEKKFGLRHFYAWKVLEFYGKTGKKKNLEIF